MNEKNELIVFVEQSGIDKVKGNQITESLNVFFAKAQEWDATISAIVINDISEVGKMKMAREGRLTLKNLRLDSDKVVKAKRDEIKYRMANDLLEDKLWLKAGQMVEAVYKNLETKLEEKEKYAENKERERKEQIRISRLEILSDYPEFDHQFTDLLNISDESFYQLISGLRASREKRIADEQAAEDLRLKKEKDEADERERIRQENERLKKEREEDEKRRDAERKKEAEERRLIEEKAKKERDEAELRLKKEREEKEALEKKIRLQKLADEKIKKDAEAKLAAELRIAKEEEKKLLKAPDEQKLFILAKTINMIILPEMKTDEGKKIILSVRELLQKVSAFIVEKSETL